ncbi:MAG: hypothetical protein NDJ89_15545 [Oligoflexia bacterium]|nr:hypothetical protein [Oligoflexia bacterium]
MRNLKRIGYLLFFILVIEAQASAAEPVRRGRKAPRPANTQSQLSGEAMMATGSAAVGTTMASVQAVLHNLGAVAAGGLEASAIGTLGAFALVAAGAGGYLIGEGLNRIDAKYWNHAMRDGLASGIDRGAAIAGKVKKQLMENFDTPSAEPAATVSGAL